MCGNSAVCDVALRRFQGVAETLENMATALRDVAEPLEDVAHRRVGCDNITGGCGNSAVWDVATTSCGMWQERLVGCGTASRDLAEAPCGMWHQRLKIWQ